MVNQSHIKRSNNRPAMRQAKMHEYISGRGEASVEALAAKFNTSPETIRRDLYALAEAGQIRKVHGGARATGPRGEGGFEARIRRNAPAKRLIAEKTLTLIRPGQTLFMDTGSTTLFCAEALARVKRLTVITNSTRIAATFAQGSGRADIYLLGGQYSGGNAQTIGPTAVAEVANYRADIALLTVGALNAGGVMDFSQSEAQVARAMLNASDNVMILADHSKLGKTAAFRLCPLERIDRLITDAAPTPRLANALNDAQVEVLSTGQPSPS